ncbi:unnamed protein product [Rotaria socialis]|uniref:Uncharacterized protein n=1 Tax=Rotaria socialis TaxID=392032 RepID=A0A818XS18_9BILA|nr:unnamed protein product [Rotaria socialis]CAF3312332.1 unnamed protein product [Rotaria socialis]CAF3741348.1 unnamed protein product [Rotaria socialis]CAF4545287.1 unnamed protein product [Rotaria socialis]CAF4627471.1 unnamed protein product [Rotaria socialis]
MTDHSSSSKPKFTLDESFDYTIFLSLTLAPDNDQTILIQILHRDWTRNINEQHLYLQSFNSQDKKLVTRNASDSLKPIWRGEWIAYIAGFTGEGSVEGVYQENQGRLYSLNVVSGQIERWADKFKGAMNDFALLENGRKGVILLGQLNTEIQIYTQQSTYDPLIKLTGWNGTSENLVTTCVENKSTIAFIHSSFDAPQEIYYINTIDQLNSAKKVTNENKLFTERNLPKGTSYRWANKDD